MRRYEDFTVGDVYRSEVGRTVTETDNLLFTMLSLNTNELHFDEEAAKATEWGKPLVNSAFTLGLMTLRNRHGWMFFFGIFFPILWIFGAFMSPPDTTPAPA